MRAWKSGVSFSFQNGLWFSENGEMHLCVSEGVERALGMGGYTLGEFQSKP